VLNHFHAFRGDLDFRDQIHLWMEVAARRHLYSRDTAVANDENALIGENLETDPESPTDVAETVPIEDSLALEEIAAIPDIGGQEESNEETSQNLDTGGRRQSAQQHDHA
jgi:hypothetical protein